MQMHEAVRTVFKAVIDGTAPIADHAQLNQRVEDAFAAHGLVDHGYVNDYKAFALPMLRYFASTRDALYMRDIISGLIKSIVFALVITGVGCQEGFATGTGSEEVGRSTTAAVVTSIFLVVLVDLVFTAIFYMTSGV